MTEISSDYGAVTGGTDRAVAGLPTRADGKPAGPGVDPRLAAAVGDADEQTRKGRDKVREGADKTKKHTKGLSDIQDGGGRGVRDVANKSSMPTMPSVPQSSPAAAQAAAPTPAPAPSPSMPSVPAPSGLATIDPGLLAALVEASQDRAASDAAEGIFPGLDGDPASASSATTPQSPDPLDVSAVSLQDHPGGPLSKEQIAGVIDQALTINGVPNDPALRAQWQELYQHMAAGESGGDPNARNNWDCVPLDYLILTQRGWIKHDDVRAGDKTIGFNARTGRSEWTDITRVVRHDNAPVVRMHNNRWDVTCTRNHRWLMQRRLSSGEGKAAAATSCPECSREFAITSGNGLPVHRAKSHGVRSVYRQIHTRGTAPELRSVDQLNSRDALVLSAAADTGAGLPISDTEAEILGWIAGDGHVEVRKHRPTLSVSQSKPAMVERLKTLLAPVPHSIYTDVRPTRKGRAPCGPRHVWRLDYNWSRSLLERAGHPKQDAFTMVLAMSAPQRAAWLRGISDAEGTVDAGGRTILTQSVGNVLDAMELAIYLGGRRPRVRTADSAKRPEHWAPVRHVSGNNPRLSAYALDVEDAGHADVWCVTTDLGSWTARNDRHMFLTGNSNATGAMMPDGAYANSSRGMWQCIPSTFAAYHMGGTSNSIYDPVASAAASMNYVMDRYNVSPSGQGLDAFMARQGVGTGGYQGY